MKDKLQIKETKKLTEDDLLDLDYSFTYYVGPNKRNKAKNIGEIILDIILIFIKEFVKDLFSVFKYKRINDKYVFLYSTTNQYNALAPLKKIVENSVFATFTRFDENRIPRSIGILLSLFYLPNFNTILKRSNNSDLLQRGKYYLIEGLYQWWNFYLHKTKPKAIIMSNDHTVSQRIIKKIAQSEKIPTIYIQHASVTEEFPKLDFDLSLLEGRDALNKYNKKGIDGVYELIGMPKFDQHYSDINTNSEVKSIGICTNHLDNDERIIRLCKELRINFPNTNIHIRPHPEDSRSKLYMKLCKMYNLEYSDSKKVNSFQFFKEIDLNIAGETSIHLEAVLMNVYPVYYQLNSEPYDEYSYLKNKLVNESFDKIQDLYSFIIKIRYNKPNIRGRAKYYIDTVNSIYDGKSTIKAKNIIINFVENHKL
ncbi:MAG: hypothetical protein PHY55_01100 [Bacteroidales bacterium]|nr:hypothetical protein [Bacteroidales bacterium]